jgi:hypothetical protein
VQKAHQVDLPETYNVLKSKVALTTHGLLANPLALLFYPGKLVWSRILIFDSLISDLGRSVAQPG